MTNRIDFTKINEEYNSRPKKTFKKTNRPNMINYKKLNNKYKGKEGVVFRYELDIEDPVQSKLEKAYILKYMEQQPLNKLRKLIHILEINNCG